MSYLISNIRFISVCYNANSWNTSYKEKLQKTIAHYLNPYPYLQHYWNTGHNSDWVHCIGDRRSWLWNWITGKSITPYCIHTPCCVCWAHCAHSAIQRSFTYLFLQNVRSCARKPRSGGAAQLGRTGPVELERGYQKIQGKFAISRNKGGREGGYFVLCCIYLFVVSFKLFYISALIVTLRL